MEQLYQPIADLLRRVGARWQRLVFTRALTRAAITTAAIIAATLVVVSWLPPAPLLVTIVGASGVFAAVAAAFATLWRARRLPSALQLARFVEEHVGTLEERLVTAVDVATVRPPDARPAFAESMVRDAVRASAAVDPSIVVPAQTLRLATWQAAGAVLALVAVIVVGRPVLRRTFDATALALFPGHVTLDVNPGDARIEAGTGLRIEARLRGNDAPVIPQILRRAAGQQGDWESVEMQPSADGRFVTALDGLTSSFDYRVIAAAATSKTFTVSVVRAPRVARIDVDYDYPKAYGLPPRTEEDGGDIYAPPGTVVRVRVHADTPAATGRMRMTGDESIPLAAGADGRTLTAQLTVTGDNAYRVSLADAQGLASRGDTEYFIRTMDDRPPDVHVVKPASDRRVTPLEEVEIEAEAADDFGVAALDLVYQVQGGSETVVPLRIPRGQSSVSATHVLYLEDLDVRPGDFLSYHVRARDIARGRRSAEIKSDIFFLEIKNFEEEFTLAQSQAAMGGGASNPQLEELVAAQKEVIVATWKLDRRASAANAQSAQDVRAVATAETDLKARVDRVTTSLRTSTMRDPRARPGGRGGQPGNGPSATRPLTEEESLSAASAAMAAAATALNALKTSAAMPPEMEALNHLLKAQADIRRREVQRQQAGGGSGSNRNIQDLSSLFDKELARHQETNYETRSSAASQSEQQAGVTDKIKELSKRQDELLRKQEDLSDLRAQLSADERKRELEKLTREQNDLRQRAEEVAQQIAQQSGTQSAQSPAPNGARGGAVGSPSGGSDQVSGGQTARASESERRLHEISDDMRASANELRREDTAQARARAERARDRLRDLEQQMNSASPEGRRRALGDLQLEAQQIADAERQIAAEGRRLGTGQGDTDARRRLAGEQERLSDRVREMQQRLRRQASGSGSGDRQALQQAAADASRELERQRLAERMQQSAEAMRGQGNQGPGSAGQGASGPGDARDTQGTPQRQEEMARALDRVADRLASGSRGRDAEADRLTDQLARAQEIRDRLTSLTEQLAALEQQGAKATAPAQAVGSDGRSDGGPTNSTSLSGAAQGSRRPNMSAEIERLRTEMNQELSALRALMGEAGRSAATDARGANGRTFEGQGMTLSAPGTEGFKQDFARWQELKRQATAVLETIESSAAKRLQARDSKDRLTAGGDDRPPSEYQPQVDSYFKALASKKKP